MALVDEPSGMIESILHRLDSSPQEVIAALDKETDQAKRLELLGQAQKILADDAVNGFLFELPKVGVWDAKLKGMWTNWPIFANDLSEVYWED